MVKKADIKKARFQKMAEEIEDYSIILMDEKGNIENWNKGAEKIKGYKASEIIGKNFRIFYPEESKSQGLPELLIATAEKEGKVRHEGWRVKKDGTRFWGSVLLTAIHDEDGQVIGFTKVTRDLTQQKENEEKLRKSEQRFHLMVEEIKDYAIILLDTEGNIENWNKGAEFIKGYKAEEVVGKNFQLFYRLEDRESNLPHRLIEEARTTGRAIHEGWRVRKDGTLFWGSITITALHDNDGKLLGFSKVTRDLTDRKKAEGMMKIAARNEELENFAYVASHDLREPLRTILSIADLLRQEHGHQLDADGIQFLDFIQQAANRMNNLIIDLLSYSRLGTNKEMAWVDCNKIFREVQSDMAASILETGAYITTGKLPVLQGFETELRQLFQNLLSNALKYRRHGVTPVISVKAEPQPGAWLFQVKDNGIGIEPKFFDKIFMLFQRLHNAEEYSGTGIGLPICKKIVELHGGRIWVESVPGEGSTFYFILPSH